MSAIVQQHGAPEAKPCPFCGWTEITILVHSGWVWAECDECGAQSCGVSKGRGRDREAALSEAARLALREWNVRVGEAIDP